MSQKLLIDGSRDSQTQVALLSENGLEDFEFESASKNNLKGNIYLGKVSRIEASLQAAFIDIGSDKVVCLIGKVDNILDLKKIRLIGSGYSQSNGIKNGGITNINDLEESIRKAVDLAENQANYEVENVSVNVSGNYIRTERVFGELFVGNQIINQNHIAEVIEIAKQIALRSSVFD